MGCDIHIFLEEKVKNKWVMVQELGEPADRRNYERFSALAGVRGDGLKPKGLPDDASDSVRLHADRWGSDGHNHSYMGINEASRIFLETEHDLDDCAEDNSLGRYFGIYDDRCMCCGQLIQNRIYRVVFWFDN